MSYSLIKSSGQENKLIRTGNIETSVSLSADGNTLVVGTGYDDPNSNGVWIFT